jgi:hypothetical protein
MDNNEEFSPGEMLSHEIIQKLVGKALLEVQADSARYFNIFADGLDEETTVAELAINAISKLKTVEVIILTTLRSIMKENKVQDGCTKFLHRLCKDTTYVLMLLNELATPEDLLEVYEESEVENAIRAYKEDLVGTEVKKSDLNELAKDLKENLGKSREARES